MKEQGKEKIGGIRESASHAGPSEALTSPLNALHIGNLRPQPEIVSELAKARKGAYKGESWLWNEGFQIAIEWVLQLDVSVEQRANLNPWSKEAARVAEK